MIWWTAAAQLAKWLQKREDAKTDAERAAADVQIEALRGRLASRDNRGLQWAVAIVALSMSLHIVAVALVSAVPALGWTIHALPYPMNEWQGSIVLSMFGLAAVGRFMR